MIDKNKQQSVYQYRFNRVGVLGSGVMGTQIAAHLANLNIAVVLFAQRGLIATALTTLVKLKPPPLALLQKKDNIISADFDNDLHLLADCDLVIEAIVEDIAIKKTLFTKIAPYLNAQVVLTSNTSGLSINAIAKILPAVLQPRFFGVHFFNPPRFMALVEIITSSHSDKKILQKLEGFISSYLGKEVVHAYDSPGFIANRLGVFAMLSTLYHAERLNIPADTVDVLTGKLIGKAKSATYRTADIVGLDILKNVVDNLAKQQSEDEDEYKDPWHTYLKLPEWIEGLIAKGHLGTKSDKGIYHKQGRDIYVFDTAINNYRLQNKNKDKQKEIVNKIKKGDNLLRTILHIYQKEKNNRYADFLWSIHRDIIHYAAYHLADIAYSLADADRALKAGFNWKEGVFASWQNAGIKEISTAIKQDIDNGRSLVSAPLPKWLDSVDRFYDDKAQAFSALSGNFVPIMTHPVYLRQLKVQTFTILLEDEHICLQKLDVGIAAIFFKSKLNALGYGVLSGIDKALDYLEENNYFALIFHSTASGVFCVGANLFEVLAACKLGRLHKAAGFKSKAKQKAFEMLHPNLPKLTYQGALYDVVKLGQKLFTRLKHGPIYTIAAVSGIALGGGCELLLHCDYVIADMNSYVGLVEVGVGVLPAFGGCKEMLLRANRHTDHLKLASQYFEQIAMAKVSSSALEAIEMGYFKSDTTTIIANAKELLFSALTHARAQILSAYTAPMAQMVRPVGQSGKANFLGAIANYRGGHFISAHDEQIAQYIAQIFSGGVDDGVAVSESWLLQLERKHFMKLIETQKTQERIEYMLKNNKPLRN